MLFFTDIVRSVISVVSGDGSVYLGGTRCPVCDALPHGENAEVGPDDLDMSALLHLYWQLVRVPGRHGETVRCREHLSGIRFNDALRGIYYSKHTSTQ